LKQDADRVGIGWRGELAAGIIGSLAEIDVIEVVAESWLRAGKKELRSLAWLGKQRPLFVHGVSMGLASVDRTPDRRMSDVARLIDVLQPELWSEHLAFVRSAGMEIGHLAAPPRTERTIEGVRRNVERAGRIIGTRPVLENIATLAEPLFSDMDETSWLRGALAATGCGMLLDLHNLYSNCFNDRTDFFSALAAIDMTKVRVLHIAGGRPLRGEAGDARDYWLDDHLQDVPGPLFAALEYVAARAPEPLSVILERDGNFPAFDVLLADLRAARQALANGRAGRFLVAQDDGRMELRI
jgi:hypothetical protein